MNVSLVLRLYRLAAHQLYETEKQSAAVKSGNGKKKWLNIIKQPSIIPSLSSDAIALSAVLCMP